MGSVDVTTYRHRHRLITTLITMKSHSVISLGAIIGQAYNLMLSVMQSVPAHPNTSSGTFFKGGIKYACRLTAQQVAIQTVHQTDLSYVREAFTIDRREAIRLCCPCSTMLQMALSAPCQCLFVQITILALIHHNFPTFRHLFDEHIMRRSHMIMIASQHTTISFII